MARNIAAAGPPPDRDGGSVRVLIVDDSVVARAVLGRMIEGMGRFRIAGSVSDVAGALAFLATNRADVILLDLEMPGIHGLTALPDLIAAGQGAKVLVVSSAADDGAAAAVHALALGAADTLVKPGVGNFAGRFAAVLEDRLMRLFDTDDAAASISSHADRAPGEFDIVAVGASTGGIHALSQMLRAIPPSFQVPILVTQHLPASFMSYFAAQLAVLAGRPCEVAADHIRVRPGRMLVAPGDAHLRIVRAGEGYYAVRLSHEPVASGCMPSVDPMFDSIADLFGARGLGVVLSGMGRDGAVGAKRLIDAGGSVIVQDKASSVVWGMPGAIAESAAAVLPPDEIGRIIASQRRPG
ncbi:response regulator [Sphingomonas koreensis]|jgi:two-component system chemotaxis response regulator CheB|uniref:protein-glutamate methylesterase n=1 Tax=Sphingomonas koreensis TaxID=93064 RepID=A0A1L6JBT8_9SPHN|nr:chemotaxis protein CheB [Sphingomonas koreensis]APR52980.1 chemotaxis response regulator protein-glutamate methylesterase [Sphingomonas koreensis]MDC7811339.1 chemotaxis protein CheB [Sphingomonas koreensis]PJI87416.1 two-component system chemotaxis response regulator CheB [Sphingomonas koreensis]RSU18175.1 response regulator [Sphingomonas koreensis]RSU23485.1 response regulator [Sphingomonas koreensis]